MSGLLTSVILVAVVASTNAVSAPFIHKCKAEDVQCLKKSTQEAIPYLAAGIPEMNVEKLDPLFYKSIDASSNNLKLILNDITLSGLKDCLTKKITRDVENNKIFLKAMCTVTLEGQYEVSGQLLVLPIEGKGKAHGVLRKILISVEADIAEKIGKDGLKHWDVKSWKHSYELKDKSSLSLENLFNGNKVLSAAINDVIESSPNEIVNEVGPPIIQALLAKVVQSVNHFFRAVPLEELILN